MLKISQDFDRFARIDFLVVRATSSCWARHSSSTCVRGLVTRRLFAYAVSLEIPRGRV